MGGLLYKDFVASCKLKKINIVWFIVALTCVFIILRVCFPGNYASDDFLAKNENGEIINLIDIFFGMMYIFFLLEAMVLINSFVGKIVENDDKNKIRGYLQVMPLGKHDYIASKYIFIVIVCYVLLSIGMLWGVVYTGYCQEGMLQNLSQMITSFWPNLICFSLFLAGIELPLFLGMGKEKAMLVKIGIGMGVAFLLIGYVLFGDVTIFSNWDIFKLMDWIQSHQTELAVISVLSPIIVGAFYYGSYRISCSVADRREN